MDVKGKLFSEGHTLCELTENNYIMGREMKKVEANENEQNKVELELTDSGLAGKYFLDVIVFAKEVGNRH